MVVFQSFRKSITCPTDAMVKFLLSAILLVDQALIKHMFMDKKIRMKIDVVHACRQKDVLLLTNAEILDYNLYDTVCDIMWSSTTRLPW